MHIYHLPLLFPEISPFTPSPAVGQSPRYSVTASAATGNDFHIITSTEHLRLDLIVGVKSMLLMKLNFW